MADADAGMAEPPDLLGVKWTPCASQARGLIQPVSSRRSTGRMP